MHSAYYSGLAAFSEYRITAMSLRQTLNLAHDCLSNAGVEHALIGGLALAALGVGRSTFDVDLLIHENDKEIAKTAFATAEFSIVKETDEVIHLKGKGLVDILIARRPLSQKMLADARAIGRLGVKCIAAEGIIALKIQAYTNDRSREFQDKADIRSLIKANTLLNWDQIKAYADIFGEWDTIQKIREAP